MAGRFFEKNSIRYRPSAGENKFNIPLALMVNSIRLDLTNVEKDTVTCRSIVLNPYSRFPSLINNFIIYLVMAWILFLVIFRNNAVIKTKKENWLNELSPLLGKIRKSKKGSLIQVNVGYRGVRDYLKENKSVVIWLAVITVAAYGFELFKF